ncbi:phosphorylase [Synechocystis sp. LKSZ1]|uniref:ATP adenylyltransferase family protein n=1 Tax=Synechocystis sp. LKSZ1 TaxID=3144951 RepID=UPI00336BD078
MAPTNFLLSPETLWARVCEQTQRALACGALEPIATEIQTLTSGDVTFLVRILANLERKRQQTASQPKDFNPFLPYDPDLYVGDLSPTHGALLNKYNAVKHHLLMITRAFEAQESPLTLADFAAALLALQAIDGLVFYNSGPLAGASQRHKHLQLVPFPLMPSGPAFPLAPWLEVGLSVPPYQALNLTTLPFQHCFIPLETNPTADQLHQVYSQALQQLNLAANTVTRPYNLLLTRQWLLLIPRSQASFQGIEVNALGFAGALLVRNRQQWEQLTTTTPPLTLLTQVGLPWP